MGKARHEALMAEALRQAEKASGMTFPNPAVGAVVVRDNRVVSRGYHRRWGEPHAEVVALRRAGTLARGADLYVTLEPCAHFGKTPPCTDAIAAGGIRRVYIATLDPNPLVNGKGAGALRRAGIAVSTGCLGAAARKLNEAYFKFMNTGLPFVTLKVAQTIDGRIADEAGHSRYITSPESRRLVKAMRRMSQAVLVGVDTVVHDDPSLLPARGAAGPHLRCVLDTHLRIPAGARLVRTAAVHPTLVYFNHDKSKRLKLLEKYGVRGVKVGSRGAAAVELRKVLEHLGGLGVQHLLVEGGAGVFSSFVRCGHTDKLVVFMAPNVMGGERSLSSFIDVGSGTVPGVGFRIDEVGRISRDVMITLYPRTGVKRGRRGAGSHVHGSGR